MHAFHFTVYCRDRISLMRTASLAISTTVPTTVSLDLCASKTRMISRVVRALPSGTMPPGTLIGKIINASKAAKDWKVTVAV